MKRVQRTRKKGGGMPPGSKYVGRGSRWGSRYKVFPVNTREGRRLDMWSMKAPIGVESCIGKQTLTAKSLILFENQIRTEYKGKEAMRAFLEPLRGYDLACWCNLGDPCHADVLLKLIREMEA